MDNDATWGLIALLMLVCLLLSAVGTFVLFGLGVQEPTVYAWSALVGLGFGWRIGRLIAGMLE